MQVELFKQEQKFKAKDGTEKTATNFFIKTADSLIPIEVKYFPDKETKQDKQYHDRKVALSTLATKFNEFYDLFPEKKKEK